MHTERRDKSRRTDLNRHGDFELGLGLPAGPSQGSSRNGSVIMISSVYPWPADHSAAGLGLGPGPKGRRRYQHKWSSSGGRLRSSTGTVTVTMNFKFPASEMGRRLETRTTGTLRLGLASGSCSPRCSPGAAPAEQRGQPEPGPSLQTPPHLGREVHGHGEPKD